MLNMLNNLLSPLLHRSPPYFGMSMSLLTSVLLVSCASNDPLEPYNRAMYRVNTVVDRYTFEPAARVYQAITPDPVEKGVSNVFSNIGEINTTLNSVLQGKFHNAAVSSSRFVWNTTLGLGGLFDVATSFKLMANHEDFGQTLRTWGVPEGTYVVLPLLGPSTVTDTVGRVGDVALSPYAYYSWSEGKRAITIVRTLNTRAKLLPVTDKLRDMQGDEYLFAKSAYLQRRQSLTKDGKMSSKDDAALDELLLDEVLGEELMDDAIDSLMGE